MISIDEMEEFIPIKQKIEKMSQELELYRTIVEMFVAKYPELKEIVDSIMQQYEKNEMLQRELELDQLKVKQAKQRKNNKLKRHRGPVPPDTAEKFNAKQVFSQALGEERFEINREDLTGIIAAAVQKVLSKRQQSTGEQEV